MGTRDDAIAEILTLIDEQEKNDDEGFTSKELKKRLGWGDNRVSDLINALLADGIISCTRVYRINRANISTNMIGYKLTDKAHDKAAAQS
jgi:hypothetical protein